MLGNINKKSLFLLILSLIIVALLLNWWAKINERNLLIEEISEIPWNYEIVNNDSESLRLTLFIHQIKTNPFFSISQTNLEGLDHVVDELEIDQTKFSNFYTDVNQNIVSETLYPITFLRALSSTEKSRRILLTNAADKNATLDYLHSLEQTTEEYLIYINKFISVLETFSDETIGYIDGTTDAQSMISWLDTLRTETGRIFEWTNKSRECLEKYSKQCFFSPINTYYPDTDVTSVKQPESLNLQSAREFVLHFANTESPHPATGPLDQSADGVSPISYAGRCTQSPDTNQAQLWWSLSRNSNLPNIRFTYIDELLFRNHADSEAPYPKLLTTYGVPYQYQPINHYLCGQYGYDIANITTYFTVWDYLKNHTIFTSAVNAQETFPLYASLVDLEKSIQNSTTTISSKQIDKYIELSSLLITNSDNTNTLANFSTTTIQNITELQLLYKDKSSYLSDALSTLNHMSDFTLNVFTRTEAPSLAELFFTQGAFSLTLLPFNQTITSLPKTPIKSYNDSRINYPNLIQYPDNLTTQFPTFIDLTKYLDISLQIIHEIKTNQI